ncbi:MAG: Maf-like protein [Phycisphaerales bacterium]|nr:MAG: Maf-like protein [Phycisphaerales bacterium]
MMPLRFPLILASRSPRRREMLGKAGVQIAVRPADLDDGVLRPGRVSPEQWVTALAWFKARRVAEQAQAVGEQLPGTIMAADTICAHGDKLLGQPRDRAEARRMIQHLRNAVHRTITGVCFYDPHVPRRVLLVDAATVRMGEISDDAIEAYIQSDQWRGKAGGYNLSERIEAGWPIECEGDPATVMGLPMQRLAPLFAGLRSPQP